MPHTNIRSRRPAVGALVILLAACIGLAACGSSKSPSTSSSTSTTAASSSATANPRQAGRARGELGKRFAAMRECLQKNGIRLPRRTPGSRPGPGGGFLGAGGGPQLPKGVTRAQYEAAVKKCGGFPAGRFAGGAAARTNSPAFRQALVKFAECMRSNGIKIPAPNTSGKGPIFSSKGLDTTSPQFRSATMKCRSALVATFRRPGGGAAKG
jgi:hypothetical protein